MLTCCSHFRLHSLQQSKFASHHENHHENGEQRDGAPQCLKSDKFDLRPIGLEPVACSVCIQAKDELEGGAGKAQPRAASDILPHIQAILHRLQYLLRVGMQMLIGKKFSIKLP